MCRFLLRTVFPVFLLVLLSVPANAQVGVAIGPRIGTLGPGLELAANVMPALNVRVMGNYLPYTLTDELTGLDVRVKYDADLQLMSFGALADWFPFQNQFRVSGGLLYNNTGVNAVITPLEAYELSGKEFAPERIGTLSAEVDYKSSIAPYVGFGLGNALVRRVALMVDLGAVYMSSPRVTMTGTGMIAPTADQAPDLEEGLSTFQWWPVVSIGFNVGLN